MNRNDITLLQQLIKAYFLCAELFFRFSICFSVCVRVDARDAAAIPLRPTDGVRMEIAPAAVDHERDPHELCDPGEDAVVGCEMTAQLAVFFVLAGLAAIGAVSLILQKHPIHSALSLIVVMIALAEIGRASCRERVSTIV